MASIPELKNPKKIKILGSDGIEREYIVGAATYFDSRKISVNYTVSGLPKLGDYKTNEEMSKLMFRYVRAVVDDKEVPLISDDLINYHVPDLITGMKIEFEVYERCLGFSPLGKLQQYQGEWMKALQELTTKIQTLLPAQSNKQD